MSLVIGLFLMVAVVYYIYDGVKLKPKEKVKTPAWVWFLPWLMNKDSDKED